MTHLKKTLPLAISMLLGSSFASALTLTLDNPGFEDGMDGWTEVDPAAISTDKYAGSKSLKISGSPGRVHQVVDITPNTDYILRAYVKGEGQIIVNTGNSGPGFKSTKFDVSTWTNVKLAFNSGSATSTQIGAKFTGSDDVRFDEFAMWTTSPTPTPTPTTPTPTPTPTTPTPTPSGVNSGSAAINLIKEYFDVEGDDPYESSNTMVFDALNSKVITPNGNGWRHEVKVAEENRVSMTESWEYFSANIRPVLSDGSKTIIAQYHAADTSTLVKVYVSDTNESNHDDSEANNGIFDVYARLRPPSSSSEVVFNFGTIRSGDTIDLTVINDHGFVYVEALGEDTQLTVQDSSESYFKFGNYLQAQDAESGDDVDDSDDWEDFYDDAGITSSVITFSSIFYGREDD